MGPTVIGGCAAPDPGCCAECVVGLVGDADGVDGGTAVLEVPAEAPEPLAGVVLCTGADNAGAAGPVGAAVGAELLDCGGRCGARIGTCTTPGGSACGALADGEAGVAGVLCWGRPDERVVRVDPPESASDLLGEVSALEGTERDGVESAALEDPPSP
jgi:hypothetical protein